MNGTPTSLYSLLPAVFRTRDLEQGGQLQAFLSVLQEQHDLVCGNLQQLYRDQFIETCAPWVIPYLGELIGFNSVYTLAATGADPRAEVANTIGYRRRKGTLLAMEQLTADVSGRRTMVVEEFRRVATTLSLRDVRPHHAGTANLRCGRDLVDLAGPFTRLNRTVDVRRIAPRSRVPATPDAASLDLALHGPGRFNVPEIAIWMWRWQSWPFRDAPAYSLGPGEYTFSTLGAPVKLFQQPPPAPPAFTRLMNRGDAPEPISRRRLRVDLQQIYPSSVELIADGVPVPVDAIVSANLADAENGHLCRIPAGMVAIDPELGRIRYAADLTPPADLRLNYSVGLVAPMGGGPYDRSLSIAQAPGSAQFQATVGSAEYPALEDAVAAWNLQPPGTTGCILLPNYECHAVDLTGAGAIRVPSGSSLLLASAQVAAPGDPVFYTASRATLTGQVEVVAPPLPILDDGDAALTGQLQISGLWLAGSLLLSGDAFQVQISDCTLVPGGGLTREGNPVCSGQPSITGETIGTCVCMERSVTGPIALGSSCSVRVSDSVVDATSPFCVAYAGADLASPGASLHIEDSTVIGKVWAQAIRLASNTIFVSRMGRHDPWSAPVWAARRQTGCVRFCSLPAASMTPRRYECLPPDAASEAALEPQFISLRFGEPGYALLSGRCPVAVWKGADNGSQMGVFLQTQETEAVANIGIRSGEYLPANLEAGIFLIPSEPVPQPPIETIQYPHVPRSCSCRCEGPDDEQLPTGIGIHLL